MLHHPGYPLELWGEADLATCYLSNRLPSRALDGKTPFEAWFGYKPEVSHLRRWVSVAYVHIQEQLRKKLDVKAHQGIFVGYDNPNGTYRIFNPATNKIISTKDWIISENEFWDFGEGTPRTSSVPNVETVMLHPPTHPQTHAHPIAPERTQSPMVGTVTPQSEHLSPAPSPPAPASPEGSVEAEIQVLPIPRAPAIPAPPPPPLREDEDQGPRKSGRQTKARDFWEGGFAALLATMAVAEAPVARVSTIRTLIAIAVGLGFKIHQMDVVTAFLYGGLKERIYVEQPEGHVVPGKEDHVLLLLKSLYGLKQAPYVWFKTITSEFIKLGYRKCESDHGIWVKFGPNRKRTFIILYMDNLLIMTEDDEELASLKRRLTARFEMKDLGEVKRFLGIEIEHESNGIKIHQADYIRTLLHRHGMQDCNSVNTAMDPSIKLTATMDSDVKVDS